MKNNILLVLNNKCNLLKSEFDRYVLNLDKVLSDKCEVVLCPSMCYLDKKFSKIKLGSQDVSVNDLGSFTGSVSASQLKSLDVSYSLVGHQEIRERENETNSMINEKIKKLLGNDIVPILCVGEVENECLENTLLKIEKDLEESFEGLDRKLIEKVVIAYEPAWAIGNDINKDIYFIESVLKEIKNTFPNNKLIYGGGVDVDSICDLKNISCIDGYLLGHLSIDVDVVGKIIENI